MRGDNIRAWQTQMRKRGWDIVADGLYGPRSATVARAFQREHWRGRRDRRADDVARDVGAANPLTGALWVGSRC